MSKQFFAKWNIRPTVQDVHYTVIMLLSEFSITEIVKKKIKKEVYCMWNFHIRMLEMQEKAKRMCVQNLVIISEARHF